MLGNKIILYSPLLKWYIQHGLEVTKIYKIIKYTAARPFQWFMDEVTEARRTGDSDPATAIVAETNKLIGNSGYGKFLEDVAKQETTVYTTDDKEVVKALGSAWFDDLEEIEGFYEISMRKNKSKLTDRINVVSLFII